MTEYGPVPKVATMGYKHAALCLMPGYWRR